MDFDSRKFSHQDNDEDDYDEDQRVLVNRESVIKFKDVEDEDDLEREVRLHF